MNIENSVINQLPLEKQLALQTLILSADKMSHEQAIDMVKYLGQQLYIREEHVKQMLGSILISASLNNDNGLNKNRQSQQLNS